MQRSAHTRHEESAIHIALPERLKLNAAGLCGNAASSDASGLLDCALAAVLAHFLASLYWAVGSPQSWPRYKAKSEAVGLSATYDPLPHPWSRAGSHTFLTLGFTASPR